MLSCSEATELPDSRLDRRSKLFFAVIKISLLTPVLLRMTRREKEKEKNVFRQKTFNKIGEEKNFFSQMSCLVA